jgi:Leucine-rich repeat (LRR) protein
MVAATVAFVLDSAVFSTCQPCKCNSEGVLRHCNVYAVAESLKMVDGLNLKAYVSELDLEGKGITKIHPGSFEGLEDVDILKLAKNEIESLAPGTFKGMDSVREIDLDSNKITLIERYYFDDLAALKFVSIDGNPVE